MLSIPPHTPYKAKATPAARTMLRTAAGATFSVDDPDLAEAVAEAAEADEADCEDPPGAVPEADGKEVEEDAGAEALEEPPPETEPPVLIPAASEYGYGLL